MRIALATLMLLTSVGCMTPTVYSRDGVVSPQDVSKAAQGCVTAQLLVWPIPVTCDVRVIESAGPAPRELERRLDGCARSYPRDAKGRAWCDTQARLQP